MNRQINILLLVMASALLILPAPIFFFVFASVLAIGTDAKPNGTKQSFFFRLCLASGIIFFSAVASLLLIRLNLDFQVSKEAIGETGLAELCAIPVSVSAKIGLGNESPACRIILYQAPESGFGFFLQIFLVLVFLHHRRLTEFKIISLSTTTSRLVFCYALFLTSAGLLLCAHLVDVVITTAIDFSTMGPRQQIPTFLILLVPVWAILTLEYQQLDDLRASKILAGLRGMDKPIPPDPPDDEPRQK